jgi:hypothetical protein
MKKSIAIILIVLIPLVMSGAAHLQEIRDGSVTLDKLGTDVIAEIASAGAVTPGEVDTLYAGFGASADTLVMSLDAAATRNFGVTFSSVGTYFGPVALFDETDYLTWGVYIPKAHKAGRTTVRITCAYGSSGATDGEHSLTFRADGASAASTYAWTSETVTTTPPFNGYVGKKVQGVVAGAISDYDDFLWIGIERNSGDAGTGQGVLFGAVLVEVY